MGGSNSVFNSSRCTGSSSNRRTKNTNCCSDNNSSAYVTKSNPNNPNCSTSSTDS